MSTLQITIVKPSGVTTAGRDMEVGVRLPWGPPGQRSRDA